MRKLIAICIWVLVFSGPVVAEGTSPLRSLTTGDDSRGWEAVGRLDINGHSMCTGALIAPDLVLTAAHCLFDKDTKQPVDVTKIEFLAGWRNGRASAYRWVEMAAIHPDYEFKAPEDIRRIRNDVALLKLSQPILNGSITPFQTNSRPRKGAEIGIVSYAFDRPDTPALQEACHVLARQSGTLVMSCEVDFGSSGAPVFMMDDGQPKIVSVVSAKAAVGGRPVSLGTSLEKPLALLMAQIEAANSGFGKKKPVVRRLTLEAARDKTGAKFLRP